MVSVCTPLWHASYELAPWVLWGSAVCVSGLSGLARALLIVRLLTMNDDGGKSVDSSHIAWYTYKCIQTYYELQHQLATNSTL